MTRPVVVVVGLGPAGPDLVTAGALEAVALPARRFLRTSRHPSSVVVDDATTFDHLYEQADTFADVYRDITDALVAAATEEGRVVYAVPGSPLVLERSVRHLLGDPRVSVEVVPGLSFLDLAYGRLGLDPIEAGLRLVDGHEFATAAAGERGPLLVAHTHAPWVLSDIKLAVDSPGLGTGRRAAAAGAARRAGDHGGVGRPRPRPSNRTTSPACTSRSWPSPSDTSWSASTASSGGCGTSARGIASRPTRPSPGTRSRRCTS